MNETEAERIVRLERTIKMLHKTLESTGQWIHQADIAVEPGWAGSQQHILNKITDVLRASKREAFDVI